MEVKKKGVAGFLILQCCACKKIKIFSTQRLLSRYECKCGQRTKLEGLVPAYVDCECGRRFKYLTNVEETRFTAKCANCGSPVEMELNRQRTAYVPMDRPTARRKKGRKKK